MERNFIERMNINYCVAKAVIVPMLPGSEDLAELLAGKVDSVRIDRMNYHYADWVYRKYGLQDKLSDQYFEQTQQALAWKFAKLGVPISA